MLRGTVTEFSFDRGLGTITTADGQSYVFHVIEVGDGSRTVEVGDPVAFERLPKFGSIEAGAIQKV